MHKYADSRVKSGMSLGDLTAELLELEQLSYILNFESSMFI